MSSHMTFELATVFVRLLLEHNSLINKELILSNLHFRYKTVTF